MVLSGLSLWANQHPRNVGIIIEDVSIPARLHSIDFRMHSFYFEINLFAIDKKRTVLG